MAENILKFQKGRELDALCPVELAMLIEDGMDTVIADDTYLSWRCVQDVLDAGEECYAH